MNETIPTKEFFENEEVFRILFEYTPYGILLVDPHYSTTEWPILQCNEVCWKMYKYENKKEILSKSFQGFFAENQDLIPVFSEAYQAGVAIRDEFHRKQDGTIFPVNCYYKPVTIKGMDLLLISVHDITDIKQLREAQERFRAIFDRSPDGIVIIDPTQGLEKWPIADCNQSFVEMNGYARREELIGQDILIVTKETALVVDLGENYREKYYKNLKKGPIRVEEMHQRKDGSIFPIQAVSCLITLNGQEFVLGVDRDITEEKNLQRDIDDLRRDVGRTFHTFTATLLQTQLAITPTVNALDPDPFQEGLLPSMEVIWEYFFKLKNTLISSLSRMLLIKDSDLQRDALCEKDWAELEKISTILLGIEQNVIVEQRMPVLRKAARQIVNIIDRTEKGKLSKELVRETLSNAKKLERMTCLVALRQVKDKLIDTDFLVRDLRERIIKGGKSDGKQASYEFWDLVKEVIEGLSEYAGHKGVLIKKYDYSNNAHVHVVRHDIVRAINNLLQNAIKYSWWRDSKVQPWIDVKSYVKEDRVYIEIEDYGVPISKEEIDNDLIFQLGYRGRLSGQRGRYGTGIGLSDARDMAKRYGGDVKLNSRPAPKDANVDDLSVPHIKTAILYLPIHKR